MQCRVHRLIRFLIKFWYSLNDGFNSLNTLLNGGCRGRGGRLVAWGGECDSRHHPGELEDERAKMERNCEKCKKCNRREQKHKFLETDDRKEENSHPFTACHSSVTQQSHWKGFPARELREDLL